MISGTRRKMRNTLKGLTGLVLMGCAGTEVSEAADIEVTLDSTTPELPYVSGLYYVVDPGVDRPQRTKPDSNKGCRCWQDGDVCTLTIGYNPGYPPDPEFRCPDGEVCTASVPGAAVCRWGCFHPDAAHVENFDCPGGEFCRVMWVTSGFEDAGLTTQGFCSPFAAP